VRVEISQARNKSKNERLGRNAQTETSHTQTGAREHKNTLETKPCIPSTPLTFAKSQEAKYIQCVDNPIPMKNTPTTTTNPYPEIREMDKGRNRKEI
jgi:hypothetical protein